MAEETKETTATSTDAPKAPKKKRNWAGKGLPIAIAAVVAVTVLGVAGWAWRATPGYCDSLCHGTMGKYYDTFVNQTDSLANAHSASVQGNCLSCHETTMGTSLNMAQSQLSGSYSTPLAKTTYTNEFCLQSGCHAGAGIMPGASESSTADLSFDPHSDFHGVQQCNSCHRMHDQSVFTCAGCHQVGAWEGEAGIPEGWTKQDLGDGQQGAVPDGWTTPFLFEAAE